MGPGLAPPPFLSAALWVWPAVCPLLGFLFPEIPPTSLLVALGQSLPLPVPLFPPLQGNSTSAPFSVSIQRLHQGALHFITQSPVSPVFHDETKAQSPTL